MPLILITTLAAVALAGCTADGLRASSAAGGSTERPAWRRDAPPMPEPAARHPSPEGLDRA